MNVFSSSQSSFVSFVMSRNDHSDSGLFSEEVLQRSYSDTSLRHQIIDDDVLLDMARAAAAKLGKPGPLCYNTG